MLGRLSFIEDWLELSLGELFAVYLSLLLHDYIQQFVLFLLYFRSDLLDNDLSVYRFGVYLLHQVLRCLKQISPKEDVKTLRRESKFLISMHLLHQVKGLLLRSNIT